MRTSGFSPFLKVRSLLLCGLVLLLIDHAVPCSADAATEPANAALPRQDARVLSEKCTVNVAADGRTVTECTVEEEVHSILAMDVFLDPRVRWRAGAQKFTVLSAYSIAPGTGKRVNTPPHAINEVTPFFEELTPLGTTWRETVISHVGVVPGSRLVRHTKLEDLVAPGLPMDGRWSLQKVRPIDYLEYKFSGITHVALVDPPAGCTLTGAPPTVTVTCKNIPGVGFSGIGGGRRIEFSEELYGRLPRVVVSAWKDSAALAGALKARRYRTLDPKASTGPDNPIWPEFLKKELALQPTPAARVETLRSSVMSAFRTLVTSRAPVSLQDVFKYRAVTVLERALLFDAALRHHVPEASLVRTAYLSSHEVIADRIPGLVEFPNPVVLFSLGGRDLLFDPASGEMGTWTSLAAGAWLLDPMMKEAPELITADRGLRLRAVHAKAAVDATKVTFTGQATWETFADAPPCAKMLPPQLGRLESCDVLERSLGLIRVSFRSVADLDGDAVANLPGLLDVLGPQWFRVMPFDAGVPAVFPIVLSRVDLEFSWKPEVWDLVRVQSGDWIIPHREPLGYGAGMITPGCRQNFSVHHKGTIAFSGSCELKRRHYYGTVARPAVSSGFVGAQAFRDGLKAGRELKERATVHTRIQPLEVWFRKPLPPKEK